ncbi:acyl-CoA thioesterase [Streptomyces monomycini]|uniref:acyl-CoA thioesterase n=1 Tax=Streptomyces monomycini TaxID=371720 RepID=UPI0004AA122E|nr:thioesterase family protein [Streptomyces monomycini]
MKAFLHHVTIRWSDVNAYGIVSDAAIAAYVEEARGALIRKLAGLGAERPESAPPLVYLTVRQRIDYLLPLHWQAEPLVISLRVLRIRPSAVELNARVGCRTAPCAEARVLSACWNTARSRPHLIASAQRALLTQYLETTQNDDRHPGKQQDSNGRGTRPIP